MPAIGVNTAKASRGAAITQVTVETLLESRSSAIVASAADSTVIVNELQATPVKRHHLHRPEPRRRDRCGGAERLTLIDHT